MAFNVFIKCNNCIIELSFDMDVLINKVSSYRKTLPRRDLFTLQHCSHDLRLTRVK